MTEKELSSFLRLLAHDLQNQIGAVDLNLQILPSMLGNGAGVSAEAQAFIDRAALSTTEMIETLSDLQRYAHALSREKTPTLSELDLPTLLRDCMLLLTPKADARKLTLNLGVVTEGTVTAERDAVVNAIRLFAAEALRCSFPGDKLTLSAGKGDDGRASLTLHASQEGLFEPHRPNLATFLATEMLKSSNVELQYFTGETRSAVRFVFS